jgi:cyclophilin family peptidyl-prolyl cis-trans isomerase
MLKKIASVMFLSGLLYFTFASPQVKLETTSGDIIIDLDSAKAPKTVANFVEYVKSGFYDGTIFHRVIPNFMIQGGGFTTDMNQKEAKAPIQNEADNGLSNLRGTIAMARTGDPHSATGQFFINSVDNIPLNFTGKNAAGWGYCVFGKVTKGMDVIDAISKVQTKDSGYHQNVPAKPIIIKKASIVAKATVAPKK